MGAISYLIRLSIVFWFSLSVSHADDNWSILPAVGCFDTFAVDPEVIEECQKLGEEEDSGGSTARAPQAANQPSRQCQAWVSEAKTCCEEPDKCGRSRGDSARDDRNPNSEQSLENLNEESQRIQDNVLNSGDATMEGYVTLADANIDMRLNSSNLMAREANMCENARKSCEKECGQESSHLCSGEDERNKKIARCKQLQADEHRHKANATVSCRMQGSMEEAVRPDIICFEAVSGVEQCSYAVRGSADFVPLDAYDRASEVLDLNELHSAGGLTRSGTGRTTCSATPFGGLASEAGGFETDMIITNRHCVSGRGRLNNSFTMRDHYDDGVRRFDADIADCAYNRTYQNTANDVAVCRLASPVQIKRPVYVMTRSTNRISGCATTGFVRECAPGTFKRLNGQSANVISYPGRHTNGLNLPHYTREDMYYNNQIGFRRPASTGPGSSGAGFVIVDEDGRANIVGLNWGQLGRDAETGAGRGTWIQTRDMRRYMTELHSSKMDESTHAIFE